MSRPPRQRARDWLGAKSLSWWRGWFKNARINMVPQEEVSALLTPVQRRVLSLGLRFVPTPTPPPPASELTEAAAGLKRSLLWEQWHRENGNGDAPFKRGPPRLRGTSQPPHGDGSVEYALVPLHEHIAQYAARLQVRPTYRRNLSKEERDALRELLHHPQLIVKPADKNLGVTVMTRTWYNTQVAKHLRDENTYCIVTEPLWSVHERARMRLVALQPGLQQAWSKQAFDYIGATCPMRHNAAAPPTANFYVIPKLHKTPVSTRPIVQNVKALTTNGSKWLAWYLQSVLQAHPLPTVLNDTTDLVLALENLHTPADAWLAAGDVESLYPNMQAKHGLPAVRDYLVSANEPAAKVQTAVALLEWVLSHNYFYESEQLYLQLQGTAMGTNVAVAYANIYMAAVDAEWQKRIACLADTRVLLHKRFIDDIHLVLVGPDRQVQRALKMYSDVQRNTINVNWACDANRVDFMDLTIYKGARHQRSGVLDLTVYQKPINTYNYLPATSFHPTAVKRSWIRAELLRYVRLCSDFADFLRIRQSFIDRLRARGYELAWLHPIFASVSWTQRPDILRTAQEKRSAVGQGQGATHHPQVFTMRLNPLIEHADTRRSLTLTETLRGADPKHGAAHPNHGAARQNAAVVIAYRRNPSIRDLCVRATMPQ